MVGGAWACGGAGTADSLAFDLHKWGYMPYEIGVILTRDLTAQTATYQAANGRGPADLLEADAGIASRMTYFADRPAIHGSRR